MWDVTNLHLPSPVETITFEGRELYLKRDDLIHPDFSGNKARKFHYYLTHDLPHIQKIISYGSAQSNAMYSLSVLAKIRGVKFEYYVDHIAKYLKDNPHGNYRGALENRTIFKLMSENKMPKCEVESLLIEEGGRQEEAYAGVAILAEEIVLWQEAHHIKRLNIFLPSGTGTTALYLQKALIAHGSSSRVYTTPCVGDEAYLREQFKMLGGDDEAFPTILTLDKKHHFGKLYRENYIIWLKLHQQTGVEFDLLYDPLGFRVVMAHELLFSYPLLYIHQGGVLGNESMLPRYQRKYLNMV